MWLGATIGDKTMRYMLGILLVFCGVWAFSAPQAEAQTFSSKGVLQDSNQAGTNRCQDGARRSQERALTIQQRINRVLTCNNQGQLYDAGSGACVTPGLSPAHVYNDDNAGDLLTLINGDGTNSVAARVGGRRGNAVTCVEDPNGCTFGGVAYEHGDTVVAYRETTVEFGQSCNSETNREIRTCNNGVFTGTFPHNTCGTDDPDDCTFNGNTVPHGGSVTAYEVERVSSAGTCNSETRVCNDGNLSGSFLYDSCEPDLPVTPDPPTDDCFFWVSGMTPPYAVIGHEGQISNHVGRGAYPDATIPFAKANSGTFDFIAIGPKTRLVIYKQPQFKGGEYIDIQGPALIGNQCLPAANYPRNWKTDTNPEVVIGAETGNISKLSVARSVYKDMFPLNRRFEYKMNKASVGCTDPGFDMSKHQTKNYSRDDLLWGGGSLKVYCSR